MRTLILLLLKRSSWILFLLMELFCAFLVVRFNADNSRKQILSATESYFVGRTYQNVNGVKKYFNLNAVADSLAAENAILRNQLAYSRYINIAHQDTFVKVQVDSLGGDSIIMNFEYVDAEVINNSVASANNYFTLNRGASHGIGKSMGVLSAHGTVGIVVSVSKHFARVKSVLNRNLKVSGNVLVNNKAYFGSLAWQDNNPQYLDMSNVPKYANISKGDSIVTNGFSTVFPEGYLIGYVDSYNVPPGSSSYQIKVRLAEDMTSLRRVYVAKNLMKEEQQTLEQDDE